MISRLRRRHLWMSTVFLGLIPAVALLIAIDKRPGGPVVLNTSLPLPFPDSEDLGDFIDFQEVWDGLDWKVGQTMRNGRKILLVLHPAREPQADLILYWIPEDHPLRPTPKSEGHGPAGDARGDQLPEAALFLGPLGAGNRSIVDLPVATTTEPGRLVLYSLPFRTVANVSRPLRLH